MLQLHLVMNDISSKASAALSKSNEDFDAARKDWDAVRHEMENFRKVLDSELGGMQDLVQQHWAQLKSSFSNLEDDIDSLRQVSD